MENIQKELDCALAILSRFNLNGDAVDAMADAKKHIRMAKGIAKQYQEEIEEIKGEKSDG